MYFFRFIFTFLVWPHSNKSTIEKYRLKKKRDWIQSNRMSLSWLLGHFSFIVISYQLFRMSAFLRVLYSYFLIKKKICIDACPFVLDNFIDSFLILLFMKLRCGNSWNEIIYDKKGANIIHFVVKDHQWNCVHIHLISINTNQTTRIAWNSFPKQRHRVAAATAAATFKTTTLTDVYKMQTFIYILLCE